MSALSVLTPTESLSNEHPRKILQSIANKADLNLATSEFAKYMDNQDSLQNMRKEFSIPKVSSTGKSSSDDAAIYFCGNSLGLMPMRSQRMVSEEMTVWAKKAVQGHFDHEFGRPWAKTEGAAAAMMAPVVGAKPIEVAVMNTLTANLHSLMTSFYKPTKERYKIIIEEKAFPSDHYAMESQIRLHGLDPAEALICLAPRAGEYTLRTEDILSTIQAQGPTIAVICLSGVQYYTGQWFEIEVITRAGHEQGCVVGWDLAHAAGNVPLSLHDWDVDFACWCSYKYLNSGPGCMAGLFVHERFAHDRSLARPAGWWGHNPETRFQMENVFDPIPGAAGWQVSNPSGLSIACLMGSLEIFNETSMSILRKKSLLLTGYLEYLLDSELIATGAPFKVITPKDPNQRGCQLSLLFEGDIMMTVWEGLNAEGVICDERKPNCIRIAPIPLYNTFDDVWRFVMIMKRLLTKSE